MSFTSSAQRCSWNQVWVRDKVMLLDNPQILFDQPRTESGEEADLVQGCPIPGHIIDAFKVPEVTVHIVGIVVGHLAISLGK